MHYDRIIFGNETASLISHECHSYLCLALANGIPRRKAMVMDAENLSNDVDEEVHVGDGVERHEAQEASAGDRRVIADADQAVQLDISGETKTARTLRTPDAAYRRCEDATQCNTRSIRRLVPTLCCESRTKFSAQTSCGETRRRTLCRSSRPTTCSFERWQRAKLSHALHFRGNRAVEW